jgi:hypothetical protein
MVQQELFDVHAVCVRAVEEQAQIEGLRARTVSRVNAMTPAAIHPQLFPDHYSSMHLFPILHNCSDCQSLPSRSPDKLRVAGLSIGLFQRITAPIEQKDIGLAVLDKRREVRWSVIAAQTKQDATNPADQLPSIESNETRKVCREHSNIVVFIVSQQVAKPEGTIASLRVII